MQFDRCVQGANVNIFGAMKKQFNNYGYDFPNIVFWNVNASSNTPMTMNNVGVQLVSGYSPSILTSLLNADGKTPYDFMLDVILSERYKEVDSISCTSCFYYKTKKENLTKDEQVIHKQTRGTHQ
jgi:hypothetical protein